MNQEQEANQTFLTPTSFHMMIEKAVDGQGISHMEAIIEFCDENDMDYDTVKKLLTTSLRDKVKMDAVQEGFMQAESCLEFENE